MMRYPVVLTAMFVMATGANAAITEYSDRAVFTAATGAGDIETFGPTYHFPITTGILDSTTVCPACSNGPIPAGMILPGVTYSTEVLSGNGNFFNIDAGGGFEGGFLDSLVGGEARRTLTVTFAADQFGFGFDTNYLMGGFTVEIYNSSDGFLGSFGYAQVSDLTFFGFGSDSQDIRRVRIAGNSSSFNFALDNFTFGMGGGGGGGGGGAVPEPATWAMLIMGFGLVGFAARRRRAGVETLAA